MLCTDLLRRDGMKSANKESSTEFRTTREENSIHEEKYALFCPHSSYLFLSGDSGISTELRVEVNLSIQSW